MRAYDHGREACRNAIRAGVRADRGLARAVAEEAYSREVERDIFVSGWMDVARPGAFVPLPGFERR